MGAFDDLIPSNRSRRPLVHEGPEREPPPQTGAQAQRDQYGVQRDAIGVRRDERGLEETNLDIENKRRTPANTAFDHARALRNDFDTLPEAKTYRSALPMMAAAFRAADNPVGDMQIITAWAKLYDPTGTVRDSDVEISQGAQSLIDRTLAQRSNFDGSGRLRPEVRKKFFGEIHNRAAAFADSFQPLWANAQQRARSAGLNPDEVYGPHPGLAHQQAEADYLGRRVGMRGDQYSPQGPEPHGQREAPGPNWRMGAGDIGFNTPEETQEYSPETNKAIGALEQMFNQGASREQLIAQALASKAINVTPQWLSDLDRSLAVRAKGGRVEWTRDRSADPRTEAEKLKAFRDQQHGRAGYDELIQSGAMLGLGDEAAGVGNALGNAVTAPFLSNVDFDPGTAYRAGREADLMRLQDARHDLGGVGTGLEIAGGFASANPAALFRAAPTLMGRAAQAVKAGAPVGAMAGAASGEGFNDRVRRGIFGAGLGTFAGAAVPTLGAGASKVWNAARTATGNAPNRALSTISQAIADDANTPGIIARQMRDAQGRGTPYMIADSGDNVRALLASASRTPGPSRTVARDALESRQEGLADRVAGAVERDLGSASNPHLVGEELMQQASAKAAPLFERTYARPGAEAFASKIAPLLQRPSMRRALERAERLAREEGDTLEGFGFLLDKRGALKLARAPKGSILAGEMVPQIGRRPTWKTLDYIKRGMDDVVETYRDKTTGRLHLDEEGRAINNTLRGFLSMADKANPTWKAARAAWAGPVKSKSAMETGLKALNMSADDMAHITRDMTPGELDFFRLGVRRSMVDAISSRGDSADVVNALLGTPKKRAMLSRLFGGKQDFDRFVTTLRDEQAGHQTYKRAFLGSPTAPNMADDAYLQNATINAGIDLATGGGMSMVTALREGAKFGAGRAGTKAREEIATILSESDPAKLTELARQLYRAAAQARRGRTRSGRRASAAARAAGQSYGAGN
jgi:hypothetical protein